MLIGIGQIDIAWEDPSSNRETAERMAKLAAQRNCDVLVLPELFTSGFSMSTAKFAEAMDGPTCALLAATARRSNLAILAGLAIQDNEEQAVTNSAVFFTRDGRSAARFDKLHSFSPSGENRHYKRGGIPVTFDIDGTRASILICYDLRFPEAFRTVTPDVSIFFVIANWPSARTAHWEALLKARAIENQAFVIGVNRVGEDDNGIAYNGCSLAFNPWGEELARGGIKEELLLVDVDPAEVGTIRRRYPFLGDRRL